MIYCTHNLLNMFRAPICPSSGARDYTCVRDEGSYSSSFPDPGRIACCPAPDRRPLTTKALHTIFGNNTSIVSSSWWWAYKCPKHVEQIISAIKHSVVPSWFSSLHHGHISEKSDTSLWKASGRNYGTYSRSRHCYHRRWQLHASYCLWRPPVNKTWSWKTEILMIQTMHRPRLICVFVF